MAMTAANILHVLAIVAFAIALVLDLTRRSGQLSAIAVGLGLESLAHAVA